MRQFLQYERTHRFLPRLGILLPCTRAISCQGEALWDKRLKSNRYEAYLTFTSILVLAASALDPPTNTW